MIPATIKKPPQSEIQRIARENMERHLSPEFVGTEAVAAAPRFANVQCSSCGGEFGPGDHGFSSCDRHAGQIDRSRVDAAMAYLKMSDPYNQAGADRTMEREIALRVATGQIA